MGIYSIKPAFQRSLRGAEDWLVARRVHPDVLTIAALVLSVLGGIGLLFSTDYPALFLTIPVVALLRTALNALDGLVAKRSGLARPWGEVLNELCDRLADTVLFGGLALAPATDHLLGAATLVAVLLSSYLGILSKAAGGPRQYGGVMGKADRMLYLSIASVVAFAANTPGVMNWFLVVVLLGALITLIQRGQKTFSDLHRASDKAR